MKYTVPCAALFAASTSAQALMSALRLSNLTNFTNTISAFPALVGELVLAGQDVTIFAPVDSAVGVQSLLQSARGPGPASDSILRYHIIKGGVTAAALPKSGLVAQTLLKGGSGVAGGQRFQILKNAAGNVVLASGLGVTARVVKSDIKFDGGYIHLIDTVLAPLATIAATAEAEGLQTLIQTLDRPDIGILETIESLNDITIFAPTDSAFDSADATLSGLNADGLTSALNYHVAKGVGYSTDFLNGQAIPTVNGKTLTVRASNGTVFINGARVLKTDLLTRNGVIHVVDKVLLPPV
ncbi:beta-Ig-H3/fasciclin [Tothia fuscella]|uniref:Beta-Ig-H3/fasciclin n=1 Tax=Tothia fuscella TaxID=1048955 RepID=A0A9P4TYP3_9PEZI|nr:beta-Ig-H3/fasciclin [Tothia fuscella]